MKKLQFLKNFPGENLEPKGCEEQDMGELLYFPGVGTWQYNADRLQRYAGQLMKLERWPEFETVVAVQELYDHDLVDIDWDKNGDPIVIAKKKPEAQEVD